ncbi:5-formyltetrahydrofolate cyclo-ligase [Fulvivirga lutea]|uniref:5-formyltetrahydrofolate cyclo-ligase n=1 Tax=Fulvivirga lutea TaxID=2810512 RepID=A0A975A1V8_9BACT|nr:5-formyltetrahydrofolate cyclo-ligase [Fulvivirga lutea]QSE97902.1 5-formyltetrahydrofolate cyclo-ligase [Fulvivirga lutea]
MASKQVLREVYLAKRLTLTEEEYGRRNELILNKVLALIAEVNPLIIHFFLPIKSKREIDLTSVIDQFPSSKFVIPKTESNGELKHFIFNSETKMLQNKWGIMEPQEGIEVDPKDIDLVIVPLIIADKLGHRIGYGKGYYDRFLAKIEALKVGVSLQPLLDKIDYSEATDVELDKVITPYEQRIIS